MKKNKEVQKLQRFINKLNKNQKIILSSIVFLTFVGFAILVAFLINRQSTLDPDSNASEAPIHSQINPTKNVATSLESEIRNNVAYVRVYGDFNTLNELLGGEIFLKYDSSKLDWISYHNENLTCNMATSPKNLIASKQVSLDDVYSLALLSFDRNKSELADKDISEERTCLAEYKFVPKSGEANQTFIFELVGGQGEGNTSRFIQYDGGYNSNLANHYLVYVDSNSPIETRKIELKFNPQVDPSPIPPEEPTQEPPVIQTPQPPVTQTPQPPVTQTPPKPTSNNGGEENNNNINNGKSSSQDTNQQNGSRSLAQNGDDANKSGEKNKTTPSTTPSDKKSPTPSSKIQDSDGSDSEDGESGNNDNDNENSSNLESEESDSDSGNLLSNPLFVGILILIIILIIVVLIFLLIRTMSSDDSQTIN